MKLSVDTNILVRAVVRDDESQADKAARLLREATVVAIAMPCLCEFVWVLKRLYGLPSETIAEALMALLDASNVAVDRPAAEAGLAVLVAGGDFADGAIAHEGRRLGGETFASFDRKAVRLIAQQGRQAHLVT